MARLSKKAMYIIAVLCVLALLCVIMAIILKKRRKTSTPPPTNVIHWTELKLDTLLERILSKEGQIPPTNEELFAWFEDCSQHANERERVWDALRNPRLSWQLDYQTLDVDSDDGKEQGLQQFDSNEYRKWAVNRNGDAPAGPTARVINAAFVRIVSELEARLRELEETYSSDFAEVDVKKIHDDYGGPKYPLKFKKVEVVVDEDAMDDPEEEDM